MCTHHPYNSTRTINMRQKNETNENKEDVLGLQVGPILYCTSSLVENTKQIHIVKDTNKSRSKGLDNLPFIPSMQNHCLKSASFIEPL